MVAKHRNGIANDENLCPDGAFKRFRAKHTKRRKKSKKKKKKKRKEKQTFSNEIRLVAGSMKISFVFASLRTKAY